MLKGITDRRARKEIVEALLRQTNLWDVRKKKLGGYSGGMRQRFGIAVALLGNPRLIIVDEPTAGLDPAERVRFLNLLSELGENSVVILSTHIVEDVSELCTRMAIINQGEILLEAEPLRAIAELAGPDLAADHRKGRAAGAGAAARGDLDEAARGPHRRARPQRLVARRRLRAGGAGPRRRLLQHHGGLLRRGQAPGDGSDSMTFWEIFRFEVAYQLRRVSTWIYFIVLLVLAFLATIGMLVDEARRGDINANAPIAVANATVFLCMIGLLITAALAGDAATRDVRSRMQPLLFTTPLGKVAYLGGRFLGAFAVNALLFTAVPVGLLLAAQMPQPEADLFGPLRLSAYIQPYLLLALPNAFVAAAILFSMAALSRHTLASYFGGVLLFFSSVLSEEVVAEQMGRGKLGALLDPFGFTMLSELWEKWTPIEKNTQLVGLDGSLLSNRLVWIALALGVLALTHLRFRFAHSGGGRAGEATAMPWLRRAAPWPCRESLGRSTSGPACARCSPSP